MARRRPTAVRRQTAWDIFQPGAQSQAAAGATLYPLGFAPNFEGLTLIRLRGELVISAVLTAASDSADVAVGLIMVSDEAFAAGVASIPSPLTDGDDDWLWHQFCSVTSRFGAAAGEGVEFRFPIDNKAMRKLPPGKTVCAVIEMNNLVGAVTIDTLLNMRTLFKLP